MQLKAATATREHLTTTFHALEARLADARRRQSGLDAPGAAASASGSGSPVATRSADRIDDELAALKRELNAGRR
jgi:phage shock protein A